MTTPRPPAASPRSLKELRTLIDALDERILGLLNERAGVAAEVGEQKRAAQPGAPFHVPAREREILARLEAMNPGPFPTDAIRSVFQEIMSACLSLERPLRVAFLGPEGTFSHQAVKYQFGLSAHALPQRSIAAVFQAVEAGQSDYGVVPVESASRGVVDATLDAFLESPLRIVAEILLPLQLALLAHPDVEQHQIRRVYAPPELLRQCEQWLAAHLPDAARVAAAGTTEAARMAREDPEGAAVAPEVVAKLFDLRVSAEGVEDAGSDASRFWVLGQKPSTPTGRDRTSLLVTVKDSPGVLLHILEPLARRGLNLTRIESRPTRRGSSAYGFFLDLEGHELDAPVAAALAEVQTVSAGVKLLGSYPRAEPAKR
jgi:chorismate mutase / prephenate dehydratase